MVAQLSLRLVLDTNVLLAGLTSESSASQRIVDGLQSRRAVPLVSREVLAEYRAVLLHPEIISRFEHLNAKRVLLALERLRFVADVYSDLRVKFSFPRDPRDAKFIELAIAGEATHIITLDRDLLSLPASRTDAGKRFRQRLPKIHVLRPAELLDQFESVFPVL
jgi:putative PIN family toxin of toxin-antitoxin system